MKLNISDKRILITGGAGFIGSNILNILVQTKNRGLVVMDNLETGNIQNIQQLRVICC